MVQARKPRRPPSRPLTLVAPQIECSQFDWAFKNFEPARENRHLLLLPGFLLFPWVIEITPKERIPLSQESTSNQGAAAPGGPSPFPPAEVEALHSLDREAARNIVCLLGGLFIVGLILYTFVAIWVH